MAYPTNQCCIIGKTKETWGEFSNMAAFPIVINDVTILTSEALYQALKYPEYPEIQKKIIEKKSPMAAKMVQKPFRNFIRDDWNDIKIEVMKWCVELKFYQHKETLIQLLNETEEKYIAESSRKDTFWGCKIEGGFLIGQNILGKIWMDIRENPKPPTNPILPQIENFKLLGSTTNDTYFQFR